METREIEILHYYKQLLLGKKTQFLFKILFNIIFMYN